MKTITLFLLTIGLLCTNVHATLIDLNSSNGHIYHDDSSGLAWFTDPSAFVGQSRDEQLSAIDDLNANAYYGLTDWHMATIDDVYSLPTLSTFSAFVDDWQFVRVRLDDSTSWVSSCVIQNEGYDPDMNMWHISNDQIRDRYDFITPDTDLIFGTMIVATHRRVPEPAIAGFMMFSLIGLLAIRNLHNRT